MSQSVLERTDSFADSDANRHARPLKHAKRLTLTQPLDLELGGRLSEVTVTYETYGRLSPSRDNAVLICHALSGDSHVASHDDQDDPGWWDMRCRSRQVDRHGPILCHLPKHPRRMPRHDRPQCD